MIRVSRAGRKAQIFNFMKRNETANPMSGLTVGAIGKRIGLRSSTYLKNILREMVDEFDEISIEETASADYFHFTPYRQQSFLDRMIFVNGTKIKVASWINDDLGSVRL